MDIIIDERFKNKAVELGRKGENNVRRIRFGIRKLREAYGEITANAILKRPGQDLAYPITMELDEEYATWTVRATDLEYPGIGTAEFWFFSGADQIGKPIGLMVHVSDSIADNGGELPDAYDLWLEDLTKIAARAESAERDAARSKEAAEEAEELAINARNAAALSALIASEHADAAQGSASASAIAKDQAEEAARSAGKFDKSAEGSAEKSEEERKKAESAALRAETASSAAATANTGSQEARVAAETARVAAQTSATTAASAASNALRSETEAKKSENAAKESWEAAEEAKTAAEDARNRSALNVLSASEHANKAETASNIAEVAAETAENARNAAERQALIASEHADAAEDSAAKAQEVLESIPEDYTDLIGEVNEIKEELPKKANIDGYYSDMSVGLAENLISPDGVIDSEPYIYRTTAGSQSVTDGIAELRSIKGNTLVWNQRVNDTFGMWGTSVATKQVNNGIMTISCEKDIQYNNGIRTVRNIFENGHVYYFRSKVKGKWKNGVQYSFYQMKAKTIFEKTLSESNLSETEYKTVSHMFKVSADNTYLSETAYRWLDNGTYLKGSVDFKDMIFVDVTLLCGSGNEFNADEFDRYFPERYYPYEEGRLLNVDIDSMKSVGFNQWNGEYKIVSNTNGSTERIKVVGGQNYIVELPSSVSAVYCNQYDVDGNKIVTGNDSAEPNYGRVYGSKSSKFIMLKNTYECIFWVYDVNKKITDEFMKKICVHLEWSGYRNGESEPYWEQTKDLSWIKEIKDADGNVMFPDGLLSAGAVHDEVTPTKAIKRVGSVDLGTLSYVKTTNYFVCYTNIFYVKGNGEKANVLCEKYQTDTFNRIYAANDDKTVGIATNGNIGIRDTSIEDAIEFKTAMSGVMFHYELAEPIEVIFNEPYNLNYKISDFGTEEFVSTSESIPQTAPVSHETFYMQNLRDEVRRLPSNYQSQDSMNNLLSALGTAFGCSISAKWDEASKSYKYTVTMNGSTQELEV